MMASTVYRARPVGPGETTFVKGYIESNTATGVTINTRDDGRGERTFYPAHLIERIRFDSGW